LNAIKFTDSGKVTLRVAREFKAVWWLAKRGVKPLALRAGNARQAIASAQIKSSENNLQPVTLTFEVEDTGSGIAPDEIDLLFEPFGQTETGRKSQQGTGLGLPITSKFVQLMGGDITVNSVVGKGSIFTFDIQVTLAEATEVPTTQAKCKARGLAPNQPNYRILVVDDRFESRLVLVALLTSIGFCVREAENGREAITLWESWEPHLILMDMRMPVMDGYEATRLIKARNQSLITKTIIIALTASTFEDERQMILSAGCDDFVGKPFREEVLLEKVSQHLGAVYICEEKAQNKEDTTQKTQAILTPTDIKHYLSQMPAEWVVKLHNAGALGSDNLVLELITQIPQENALLIATLSDLVNEFQFEKIIKLTQQDTDSTTLQPKV
jgi:two-component system sensor histidine kinase/response regulator